MFSFMFRMLAILLNVFATIFQVLLGNWLLVGLMAAFTTWLVIDTVKMRHRFFEDRR